MASHNTHANPKGIMFKLGMIETNSISAGATNTGFTDPAHQTAISLLQITTTLLLTKPNIDVLIRFEVLKRLEKRVGTEFLKIQKQIEKMELELNKNLSHK